MREIIKQNIHNCLLYILFTFSVAQLPLYTSNQTTYFFRVFNKISPDNFSSDWMSTTIDPHPFFTTLTANIFLIAGEYSFVILNYLFCFLFIVLLANIIFINKKNVRVKRIWILFLAFFVIPRFESFYTLPIGDFSNRILGGFPAYSMLSIFYEPSSFGVMYLVGLYIYLKNSSSIINMCSYIFFATIANYIQPAYMPITFCIIGAIIVDQIYMRRTWNNIIYLLIFFGLLNSYILFYIHKNHGPTSLIIWLDALSKISEIRNSHLDNVKFWIEPIHYAQIFLSIIVGYQKRKTELGRLIIIITSVTVFFMLFDMIFEVPWIHYFRPWRITVLSIPLVVGLALAKILGLIHKSWGIFQYKMLLASVLVLAILNSIFCTQINNFRDKETSRIFSYIKKNKTKNDIYLIHPTGPINDIRLKVRTAIYVDFFMPFKDFEIMEWLKRIEKLALLSSGKNHEFQASKWWWKLYLDQIPPQTDLQKCSIIRNLYLNKKITHIVFSINNGFVFNCSFLFPTYRDDNYLVASIRL